MFPSESLIAYNLACYECQMGNQPAALDWLQKAIKLGDKREIKKVALRDRRPTSLGAHRRAVTRFVPAFPVSLPKGRILTLPPPLVPLNRSQPDGGVVFSLSAILNGGEGGGEVGLLKRPLLTKRGCVQVRPPSFPLSSHCFAFEFKVAC